MGIALDKEQQRALVEDGVVMVKGLLEPELLRRVQACFDWSIVNPGPLAIDASTDAGIYRIDNYNPDALEFYRDTIVDLPFCGLLADAWGSNNVWYYAEELFWRKGVAERTFWHQDTSYSPWGGSHWVNCWMPLNGVPEDYSLEVVRGSHQGTQYDGTAFDHDDPTKPFFWRSSKLTANARYRSRHQERPGGMGHCLLRDGPRRRVDPAPTVTARRWLDGWALQRAANAHITVLR